MSVAIIIPTTNNLNYLQRTIETVLDYTQGVEYRVIVIDNGSSDGTIDYIFQRGFAFERNSSNLGFIKATNQGLERLKPGEHALLLNDDVQITDPQWLARLVADLDDPTVGAVGPVSNYAAGLQDVRHSPSLPLTHETKTLIGAFMLIRADAVKKVGLLDERYGHNMFEDFDYCFRLANAGYRLLVDRRVFILHRGSVTLKREPHLFNARLAEGERLLVEKWGKERWADAQRITDDVAAFGARLEKSLQAA